MIKCYYESGILQWEIPIKNNKENGIEKQYYENGKIKREIIYTNGVELRCIAKNRFNHSLKP